MDTCLLGGLPPYLALDKSREKSIIAAIGRTSNIVSAPTMISEVGTHPGPIFFRDIFLRDPRYISAISLIRHRRATEKDMGPVNRSKKENKTTIGMLQQKKFTTYLFNAQSPIYIIISIFPFSEEIMGG